MTAVNTLTGKAVYVEFDGLAITGDVLEFDPGFAEETGDATTQGDALMVYGPIGLEKCEPKLKLMYRLGTSNQAIRDKLKQGNEGALIWGEQGNGTGAPKWGIDARVSKYNVPSNHKNLVEVTVEFVNRGSDWLFDGRTDTF